MKVKWTVLLDDASGLVDYVRHEVSEALKRGEEIA